MFVRAWVRSPQTALVAVRMFRQQTCLIAFPCAKTRHNWHASSSNPPTFEFEVGVDSLHKNGRKTGTEARLVRQQIYLFVFPCTKPAIIGLHRVPMLRRSSSELELTPCTKTDGREERRPDLSEQHTCLIVFPCTKTRH